MSELAIKNLVDEYAKWDKLLDEAKKEIENIKGMLQKKAVENMENSKLKQVEFFGTGSNKAVVTTSETVKLVSYTFVQKVLGDIVKDFVKEDTNYKMTEPFKRVMTAIFQGNYIEQNVDDIIKQISKDDKIQKTLKKKLKGNYAKDIDILMTISGLTKKEAEHFAYFIEEAVAYERIAHLLEAAGYSQGSPGYRKALDSLKYSVIVDEGIKIGIEYEEDSSR